MKIAILGESKSFFKHNYEEEKDELAQCKLSFFMVLF